ncbi:hypothetical protein LY474_35755 [Myxococcus stipitatus]|uniref:hypothetical protein n=1 Tax=Myxococcus stipitatus TaxID=83455 RepID=UPI001F24A016|nr:hypothetical protein [Myxococcus stipitatus]MCE9673176.1 hypothetical protein [Myxococcus stipitatus]
MTRRVLQDGVTARAPGGQSVLMRNVPRFRCLSMLLSCAKGAHPVAVPGEPPLEFGPGAEVHLPHRLAFGPTRVLLKEVRRLGMWRWLEARLAGVDAAPSATSAARLREPATLRLSTQALLDFG